MICLYKNNAWVWFILIFLCFPWTWSEQEREKKGPGGGPVEEGSWPDQRSDSKIGGDE